MFFTGIAIVVGVAAICTLPIAQRSRPGRRRRPVRPSAVGGAAFAVSLTAVLFSPMAAGAAIVPTVPLGTAAEYAVLGGQAVTNTGPSTLGGKSLGVSPGSSITGFPPGLVPAPGVTHATDAAAAQAQSDLTAAYDTAAGRPTGTTTTADLANVNLGPGVYAGPSRGALLLTGPMTLDAGNDPTAVFIFQTDSSLTTGSASSVNLINGAQECNVFWQVGSSATLGTGSTFVGNILALTSITVTTGVTVHGRALARNAAVTLDNDTFVSPTCAGVSPVDTNTTTTSGATTTTAGGATTTTAGGATTTTAPGGATTSTAAGGVPPGGSTTVPGQITTNTALPATGSTIAKEIALGVVVLALGGAAVTYGMRRRAARV